MKQFYRSTLLAFLVVMMASGVHAQTTNTGSLYISPNTQFSVVDDFQNEEEGEFYNDGETFIYSNFENNGSINFFDNTGITRFQGWTPQHISGLKESYLNNVLFNNESNEIPFLLSGAISIEGQSNFLQGIVDNDTYGGSISFGENAQHINTSDASHVDGYVIHYGTEDFTFPIGDKAYYRFAGTAELQNATSTIDAKYHFENSNALYPHHLRSDFVDVINENEYWIIENLGASEEAFISLSWREETTPSEIIATPREERIHILRWDETENRWIDEGGIVDNANQRVSTLVNKYGVFTLARMEEERILPCQVSVYNAITPNGDGVNDYFSIQTGGAGTCTQEIEVEIYNRWGVKVFESRNYGVNGDFFDGYSRGRLNVSGAEQLPTGTYFYILKFDYESGGGQMETFKKAGYLYLNGN